MARYGDGTRYKQGARYGDPRHPIVQQLTDAVLWSCRCFDLIVRRRC